MLAVPVVWFAVIIAQNISKEGSFFGIWDHITENLYHPFALVWTEYTLAYIVGALVLYGLGIAYYYSTVGNTRRGEEHGSAKWGNAKQINKRYADRDPADNIILTENVRMGLDGRKHFRNQNVLVVGGSGASKTRGHSIPSALQANCSYIFCDPKGEILRSVGTLLSETHDVKVFDLIAPERSDCFNPFFYMRNDTDVLKLITNLITATTPKGSGSNDPFWEKAETALLSALMLYLIHEAPRSEQNFATIMFMLENAGASEQSEDYKSPLDVLFEALEEDNPQHIAVKQYRVFKQASGKTAMSILVSAAVRLAAFSLPEIQRITSRDDLDLGSLGERKRAIFCIIPDTDTSLNYLVSMLYTTTFQTLYHKADFEHGGALPVHVRMIMDEWANVMRGKAREETATILSTCRSRNISLTVIVQNLAQIKDGMRDTWETIPGNCDTLLYLGGNEQSTHEYISKLLGKATIDTRTRGITRGRSGSSSENFQNAGRELMTPDEVRVMDNRDCLLFIRGERPVYDHKYDLMKHPNIKRAVQGGGEPYERAAHSYERPDISFTFKTLDDVEIID